MSQSDENRPSNRLARESSVYLRQHMYNPVDWYPWGDEALARARSEDRPLLVSIGYSACHWCHVMERESFEDPRIAALMNEHFVCIKVDREERPDVDQVYMDAVTRFIGRGGWPLTAFCDSAGVPFYGGTYFPPKPRHGLPGFGDLLVRIADTYRQHRGDVVETTARLRTALEQRGSALAASPPGATTLASAARNWMRRADREHGGFGAAPKFPTPPALEAVLAATELLPRAEAADALAHVVASCRSMARGGIYDQLGGGFHRYSVDACWDVPHFEKMLYDQGQLLRVFAEAWRRSGVDDLVWPIRETFAFLKREMAADDGGFFASIDADSEGVEGRYYVWTPAQVAAALGGETAPGFAESYGVRETGNLDGASVLRICDDAPRDRFRLERERLRLARETRVRPTTDTKRLSGWNALLASGLARAGSLLEDTAMLDTGAATADFVLRRLADAKGARLRVFDAGQARVPAFLDDLAALLEACLDLHRAGAGDRFLSAALELAENIATRFYDREQRDLFFTPNDGEALVSRPRSDHDGATPHSSGLATLGLIRVAAITERADLRDVADELLRTHAHALERAPEAFPTLARAAHAWERGIRVAVIVAHRDDPAGERLATAARRALRPEDAVIVGSKAGAAVSPHWFAGRETVGGRATGYLCRGAECSLPVHSPDELAALC